MSSSFTFWLYFYHLLPFAFPLNIKTHFLSSIIFCYQNPRRVSSAYFGPQRTYILRFLFSNSKMEILISALLETICPVVHFYPYFLCLGLCCGSVSVKIFIQKYSILSAKSRIIDKNPPFAPIYLRYYFAQA